MKRILSKRILSATLVLALALALCTTASAEVYTHPEAGFGFTVPEGWIAIDGQNAAAILEVGKELVDLPPEALAALDQAEGMAMVFLYEKAGAHP
ncbi:MAG: hypothetical protein FWE77_06000, partial [Clostridia bacterium]|nr:hypothetical protein [Clostridia bacterium]